MITYAIELEGISKRYRMYPSQRDRLKELASLGRKKKSRDFWALKDVNIKVERGTALGVLGRNGAGKSTLLEIVSGVLQPTRGSREVNGRLAALLQLGAGFNKEFTGRENIILNGLILGIDRKEMLRRFDEIVAFADIGEFIDQPMKNYSSGMRARLGFAVAVNVEPDVLLVDETLSVGDGVFRQMGLQKMHDLRDSGTTVLFVSHSPDMVRNFCTEAMLLHKGEMLAYGEMDPTIERYQALIAEINAQKRLKVDPDLQKLGDDEAIGLSDEYSPDEPSFQENPETDRGRSKALQTTGEAKISDVEVLDENDVLTESVEFGSRVRIRIHVKYNEAVADSAVRIALRNKGGLDVFSTTNKAENAPLKGMEKGDRIVADFAFEVPIKPGSYTVSASVASPSRPKGAYFDRVDVAAVFKVSKPKGRANIQGLVHLPTEAEIHIPANGRQSRSA